MTPAQISTLRAAMLSEPALTTAIAAGATGEIAQFYNTNTASFTVWKTNAQAIAIYDKIIWANMTPVDVADGSVLWTNRSLACQGKQFNLQTILQGRTSIDASKANIRAGLQDALTGLPSGAAGANQGAGWVNVNLSLQRIATNGEKLFAAGVGTPAAPALLVFEGNVSDDDVVFAFYGA